MVLKKISPSEKYFRKKYLGRLFYYLGIEDEYKVKFYHLEKTDSENNFFEKTNSNDFVIDEGSEEWFWKKLKLKKKKFFQEEKSFIKAF